MVSGLDWVLKILLLGYRLIMLIFNSSNVNPIFVQGAKCFVISLAQDLFHIVVISMAERGLCPGSTF